VGVRQAFYPYLASPCMLDHTYAEQVLLLLLLLLLL
jgi:hypothetical protein